MMGDPNVKKDRYTKYFLTLLLAMPNLLPIWVQTPKTENSKIL